MTNPTNASEWTRSKRLEEASQWLLRMHHPQRTDAEMTEWLRWLDADPENLAEFERLQGDWIDLNALKGEEFHLAARDKTGLPEPGRQYFFHRYFHGRSIARRRSWGIAAAVAAVTVAAAVFYQPSILPSTPRQPLAAVTIHRAATLPDGSKMILGMQSRVNMDFNGAKRQLDLSSGVAYFEVKHDESRPFVVQAGDISVTAVGTAFDVRRERNSVTVTVAEGTVEVSSLVNSPRPATWRAEAGYQLTYSTLDHTASLANVNPGAKLDWRNGQLAYIREPLGAVVENLNRYSTRKIVIEDAEIATLPFTGTAFASSLDDWVAGIEQAYPIKAKHTSGGDIILSTRK
jgi:transmembrane sensor